MCEKEYINIQTGKKLDLSKLNELSDNAMLKVAPELWCELDLNKNKELNVNLYNLTKGSSVKLWWYCDTYDDSYPMSVNKKLSGRGCSMCSGYYITKKNSFATIHSDILQEWSYELNDVSPYSISRRSGNKYWWKCEKCNSNYEASVDKRVSGTRCPYCRGLKVNTTNNLKVTHPHIARMWHPTKNGKLTPFDVVKGSHKKVYWLCGKCSVETYQSINGKKGCAYCEGQKVITGVNDIATVDREFAELFYNKQDARIYMCKSNSKAKFECQTCGNIEEKIISDVYSRGFKCNKCSVGSFGERFIYELLSLINIDFKKEVVFDWCKSKRFDFYIPSINCIVEVNGEQHRRNSFIRMNNRTYKEEVFNDEYKNKKALENGISNYIILNHDSYDIKVLKDSILNSGLLELLNVNYEIINSVNKFTMSSPMEEVWELSNNGMKLMEIVKLTNISKTTVRNYLNIGNELKKCNYIPRKSPSKKLCE